MKNGVGPADFLCYQLVTSRQPSCTLKLLEAICKQNHQNRTGTQLKWGQGITSLFCILFSINELKNDGVQKEGQSITSPSD